MILVTNFEEIPPLPLPIALTIGTFDGVHKGHQHRLEELKKYGTAVLLTFQNHPAEVLTSRPPSLLTTFEEKLSLFKAYGVDCVLAFPFTRAFADQPYDRFLAELKQRLPFSTLLMGKGDRFGKNNEGDESRVKALEERLNFKAIYLEKISLNGKIISSTLIRDLLQKGEVEKASSLLGYHPKSYKELL